MAFDFRDIGEIFQDMGIYDVVLPFFLIFTIMFAFLQKTEVLGGNTGKEKNFNVILSIIMGLLLVRIPELVEMINGALPKISVMIVAIVMVFIIIAMFHGEGYEGLFKGGFAKGVFWVALIFVGWAFWSSYSGASMPSWLWWVEDNLATIITLGVFAGVIALITMGDDGGDGNKTTTTPPPEPKKEGS